MLKETKFEDKTVKSTQPLLVHIGLHDFLVFSNRTAHTWRVQAGKHMSGLSLFRPSQQSNISTSGEERFKYPLPWENKISQMPYPRANKDNQIPTLCPALPFPHPPTGFTLIGALREIALKGHNQYHRRQAPWSIYFSLTFAPFLASYQFICSLASCANMRWNNLLRFYYVCVFNRNLWLWTIYHNSPIYSKQMFVLFLMMILFLLIVVLVVLLMV